MAVINAPAGTTCPRPEKKKLTKAEALATLREVRRDVNPAISAYECSCGAWHHGKDQRRFDNHLKAVLRAGSHKSAPRGRKRR